MKLNWADQEDEAHGSQHARRMSFYAEYIGHNMGFAGERVLQLRLASVVHDIGKIDVPNRILLKTGQLTHDEYALVKRHAMVGYTMLTGSRSRVFDVAASIALTHHECFNGAGYPQGLKGDAIPVEGRIAAIADVFDALTTKRPYKAAYQLDESISIMEKGRETHFDPEILDFFVDTLTDAVGFVDDALN